MRRRRARRRRCRARRTRRTSRAGRAWGGNPKKRRFSSHGLSECGNQELDIAAGLFDRRLDRCLAGGGGVERAQFLAEGFLVTGPIFGRLEGLAFAAPAKRKASGKVAQIGRRKG